jgi:hypothetical protein
MNAHPTTSSTGSFSTAMTCPSGAGSASYVSTALRPEPPHRARFARASRHQQHPRVASRGGRAADGVCQMPNIFHARHAGASPGT